MKWLFKWIVKLNLWMIPPSYFAVVYLYKNLLRGAELTPRGNGYCWLIACIVPIILLSQESRRVTPPKEISSDRKKALYQPPPKTWVKDELEEGDFQLGLYKGKYVAAPLTADYHWTILGASGSNKTTGYIGPLILANEESGMLILDSKGRELANTYAKIGDPRVKVFDPSDRTAAGYNMLYSISETSTMNEIVMAVSEITRTLLPVTAQLKEPFWVSSAQAFLNAALTYRIWHGDRDIVSCIQWIKSRPAKQIIDEVLKNTTADSYPHMTLINFKDYPQDTLGSIISQVDDGIKMFLNSDVQFALQNRRYFITPNDLEDAKHIFISIDMEMLKLPEYQKLCAVISEQMLGRVFKRDLSRIDEYRHITFILEELSVYLSNNNAFPSLMTALRTARGYKTRIIGVYQTKESLADSLTREQITDFMSQTNIVVLDCGRSSDTMQQIIDAVGTYQEREQSESRSGGKTTMNTRYSEKDILRKSDLQRLGDECIVLINRWGHMKLKKNPDYSDPWLREKREEIRRHNDEIRRIREVATK